MQIRLAAPLQSDSILDGEGIRTIVWTQGCAHKCPGCHNPGTHSFDGGYLEDIDNLKKELKELKGQTGITLSGGDPLYQIEPCLELCKFAQSIDLDVWCYTGFTFEELLQIGETNKKMLELLKYIDVIVDGKFDIRLKSYDAIFRGSSNQRIIDVQESLKKKEVVLVAKYLQKEERNNYRRSNNIYV